MMDSFCTTHRFFDNKHYPRGFSRHGHFTIREAQLLEKFGEAYDGLCNGSRVPVTDEERRFVAVCHGQFPSYTAHEKVWIKYLEYIKRPKRIHTLLGGYRHTDVFEEQIDFSE